MTVTAIELEGLTKRYGTRPVLDGLDLRIDGGVVALLGPNGAGKTTLVHVLATLVRPDQGTARVLGHDVVREPRAVRRLIGVTGQYAAVDEMLTGPGEPRAGRPAARAAAVGGPGPGRRAAGAVRAQPTPGDAGSPPTRAACAAGSTWR